MYQKVYRSRTRVWREEEGMRVCERKKRKNAVRAFAPVRGSQPQPKNGGPGVIKTYVIL
jgi:hypothetical protein